MMTHRAATIEPMRRNSSTVVVLAEGTTALAAGRR
jgi:hypothetical protein